MSIVNLPQDIFSGKTFSNDEIIIHPYEVTADSIKGKSILHTNAISLVIKGKKTMHFAEKTVVVNSNEFHFLSSGNCVATIDLSMHDAFKSILIFFSDKALTDFYVQNAPLIQQLRKGKIVNHEPYLSFDKDEFINNYISSLHLMTESGQVISRRMKQLKFEELLLYLLEREPLKILSFHRPPKGNDDLGIRKVVESNVMNNLTVEELAFLCNLSLSTFKRRFIDIYNLPPNKWFLRKKMEIAANLLRNHNKKPSDVFPGLGYENHSSFSKSFKQIYGITPKAFKLKEK